MQKYTMEKYKITLGWQSILTCSIWTVTMMPMRTPMGVTMLRIDM